MARFTVIGATTRVALLTSPLRDRFGSTHRMEFYSPDALYDIVIRSARILGVQTTPEGAHEIARRARGTPRIVNRLLRRVRDYAQVVGGGVITLEIARVSLAQLEIDELGLDENDRRLIRAIIELFNGGPVGLSTLGAALAEEVDAILASSSALPAGASPRAAPTSTWAFRTSRGCRPRTAPSRAASGRRAFSFCYRLYTDFHQHGRRLGRAAPNAESRRWIGIDVVAGLASVAALASPATTSFPSLCSRASICRAADSACRMDCS